MMAPAARGRPGAPRAPRNLNRNKRLFAGGEGGLRDGEALHYMVRGAPVLSGVVVIDPAGASGIRCAHCAEVVSCSQFEAHAGYQQRRQPYEHIHTAAGVNLKAIAAAMPDEGDEGGGAADAIDAHAREILGDLDTLCGGCVLCRETDFQKDFGPRTIMICEQCEREFHVGCLPGAGLAPLAAEPRPEDEWLCSRECGAIRRRLRALVARGEAPVPGAPGLTLQVLNGAGAAGGEPPPETAAAIAEAAAIIQASFDPIIDMSTSPATDLLPLMLHARAHGEWDYRNVHVLLLRRDGAPVAAATSKVFGPQLAELPLVATLADARRQGLARVLVDAYLGELAAAGVARLALPSAQSAVATWKGGFGFEDMPDAEARLAVSQLRILVFPGTSVLWRPVEGAPPATGHHVLSLPPAAEAAIAIADVVRALVDGAARAAGDLVRAALVPRVGPVVLPAAGAAPPPPPPFPVAAPAPPPAPLPALLPAPPAPVASALPPMPAAAPTALPPLAPGVQLQFAPRVVLPGAPTAPSSPPAAAPAPPAAAFFAPRAPPPPPPAPLDPYEAMIAAAMAEGAEEADGA
jgi:GNAT superfamily N-acetyltransferase